jgi:hypothetical protein
VSRRPTPFWHPTLGFDRQVSDQPHLCSMCCEAIDEESVPLMLFSETGELAWIYCDDCAGPIMGLAAAQMKVRAA